MYFCFVLSNLTVSVSSCAPNAEDELLIGDDAETS